MPKECKEKILRLQNEIDRLRMEIQDVAKEYVPDYHFLDYSVSTFWHCKDSPVELCVFEIDNHGRKTICRYCGNPNTRK